MTQYTDLCKPSVEIINYTEKAPLLIAGSSKLTLSSKPIDVILSEMDENEIRKWVVELIRRGHGTPLEHAIYSFEITCSRACSHQLVRHRIASYTQLSQRRGDKMLREVVLEAAKVLGVEPPPKPLKHSDYAEYVKVLESLSNSHVDWDTLARVLCRGFIIPPKALHSRDYVFLKELLYSLTSYYKALANGYTPEDARFLLPQAAKTRVYVTMNARELVENFLPLRMCSHAQWEIRYIAWSLWRKLSKIHKVIFAYTGPRCVLLENRVRSIPCSLEDFLSGKCCFTITKCPELVAREHIGECLESASRDPWMSK